MLAIYLSTTVVLLICLAFTGSRRAAGVSCWMGAAICVFVTIDTFSRSGWFVLSAFAPVVFVHQLWRRGNLARAVLPLTAVVALITVAALLSPVKVSDRLTIDESVMSREHMIAVGTNMIRHHPFFGVGLGNYVDLQYSYDETDIGITTIFPHILHNIYFLIAAEQGLLGLLAFLWLNLSIALLGLRFVRGPTSFLSNMGIAFWCTIFMFFVFGMVNPLPRFTYVFAPLGVLVAIHRIIELQDAGEGHGHAEA